MRRARKFGWVDLEKGKRARNMDSTHSKSLIILYINNKLQFSANAISVDRGSIKFNRRIRGDV